MTNTDAPHENDNRIAVGGPVQRQVRRGAKVQAMFDALQAGPMRAQDARVLGGAANFERMVKAGAIATFSASDPGYVIGGKGKKPMCLWACLDAIERRPRPNSGDGRMSKAGKERQLLARIDAAVSLLVEHGYSVTAPNVRANLEPTR